MKNTKFQEYINEIKYFNLQDLKFNNISEWPTLIRWVSPFALFLFSVFLFDFFYASDAQKEISTYQKEEYSELRKIDSKALEMANKRKMKAQIKNANEHFETVREEFPENINIKQLTEKLLSGHDIDSLDINKVNINSKVNNDYYSETPIKILANGDYHSFGKFITHLANSEEMFSIETIIIEPTENNRTLKFELTLKTYESNNKGLDDENKNS